MAPKKGKDWSELNAAIARVAAARALKSQGTVMQTESRHDLFPDMGSIPLPQLEQQPDEPGPLDRFFDVLGRLRSAGANLAYDTVDPDPNTDNPLESLWAGLSGIDKREWREVIDKSDEVHHHVTPDWVKGVAGFVGDVAFDPVSYIPLGWVGKGATAARQLVTGGKAATDAAKEAGHVIPEATSAADAIAAHTPPPVPPPSQVTGAGAAHAARGEAHDVRAAAGNEAELGMPSMDRLSQEHQIPLLGPSSTHLSESQQAARATVADYARTKGVDPEQIMQRNASALAQAKGISQEEAYLSRYGADTRANAPKLGETLDEARVAPESVPLFDEMGRDTYRLSNAGPKAAAPAFDFAKMGDDIANLAATDAQQLRRVGLNGPAVEPHAGEQQLGLFGKGDLTSVPPKVADETIADVAAPTGGRSPKGLFTQREMNTVADIPMNWSPELRNIVKNAAAKGPLSKEAMKLTRQANRSADRSVINEAVAAKVADNPAVTQPAVNRLTAEQIAARADSEASVKAFTSSGTPMTAEKLRNMRAEHEAKQFGETVDAAYTRIYGKDTHVPAVTSPNTTGDIVGDAAAHAAKIEPGAVTNAAIKETARTADISLADAAKLVTGKEATEILQDGRLLTDPAVFDMRAQWTNAASIVSRVDKELTKAGLRGEAKVAAKMKAVLAGVKAVEAANIAKGIYPEISASGDAYRMGFSDIWESLGTKATRNMQFSPHSIPLSSQATAAAKVLSLVSSGITDSAKALREIAAALSAKPGAHWTGQEIRTTGTRATSVAKDMWAARDELAKRALNNELAFKTRDAVIGKQVGEEVADDVIRKVDDVSVGVGDKMNAIANVNREATKLTRERGASAGGAAVASAAAAKRMGSRVTPLDVKNARHVQVNSHAMAKSNTWNTGRAKAGTSTHGGESGATKLKTQGTQEEIRRAGQANANENINVIEQAGKDAGVGMDELAGWTSDGLWRKMVDGISRLFSGGYGMGTLFSVGRGQFNHFGDVSGKFANLVNQAQKIHKLDDSNVAFEALRNGAGKGGLTTEQAAAYDALEELSLNTISTSKGILSWGDTPMFRESLNPDTVNQVLHKYDPKHSFRPKDNHLEVPEQWKGWTDIDNPWQFLTNMHHAQMELAARSSVGRYFTKTWGSTVAKAGYVKIKRTEGLADLSHVIDTNLYYPREVAEWLGKYSREVDVNTKINHKLVSEWLDPYLSMWKTSTTIIRPGHQIRNGVGDTIFTMMDGVINPLHYKRAFNVQRAAGDFTGTAAGLRELAGDVMPKPTGHAMSVSLKGGKTETLTNNQIYWLAHRSGLLLDYKPAQDIIETAGRGLGKLSNAIENTRPVKFMGRVSEGVSNNTRLAHIMGLMSSKKISRQYDSVESMFNGLTARVQKFHPDVRGLTKFEQKYMRRIIPFYSWFKQSMPTLFMTTITHPARVTVIPKAQYNLNVAMGGDPQDYQNPFDATKLYPDFVKGSMSGAFGSSDHNDPTDTGFLMDWGSPLEGAASMFNTSNTGAALAGMVNPLVGTPWGLISGNQPLDSSHYIPDKGEWTDKALPFLNQVANVTGYSPSGSLESLLSSGKLDEQRAMEKGEKDSLWNQNMLNFMTGLNIQNTERPSYWDIAKSQGMDRQKAADSFLLKRPTK